jgi:GTP-binding protein
MNPKQAEALFKSDCVFTAGADVPEALPREAFPEVAFIGRSNVGKSSLLNALTFQKKLAHVSNTPGRTQQLNFFRLGNRIMLVDMPGYGYAKASKTKMAAWSDLAQTYLRDRRNLQRLCLLIDIRHGFKDIDETFMDFLDEGAVPFVIVLTKADEVRREEAAATHAKIAAALKTRACAWQTSFVTSAEKDQGLEELRLFLAQHAR